VFPRKTSFRESRSERAARDPIASRHAREQRVPRAMVLCAVGPCPSKPASQDAKLADLIDVELLPSMCRAAVTFPVELKAEQRFDTTPNTVVMRLDDPSASAFVDELDKPLVTDRADEVVVHGFTVGVTRARAFHAHPRECA
jgi:hypothetical protein